MLKLENVHTHYGAIEALHDVSVHVEKGEIVTLIGANGAGKTTLLMTVCGNPRATHGNIFFNDENIVNEPTSRIMRRGIGISPEGRRVFPDLTVLENLKMGGFFLNRQDIEAGVEHVYELFPRLRERSGQRAGTMSGGEQQMLAIARALATNPKVLLLDEPLEGLAPIVAEELLQTLAWLVSETGLTTLIVEQNPEQILPLTTHAIILDRGRIAYQDAAPTLLHDVAAQQRWLGLTEA